MTIKEIEQNIIEEFACYEEWLDKYAYIIELGKECPEIDPADKKEVGKDYTNRVFTQDYITTMSMRVTSLAKAYTCMPDLLAPRLEVGVQVVTKWIQATTTNVEL